MKPPRRFEGLILRHPVLCFLCWLGPKIRGSREHPLEMRDIERVQRLLGYIRERGRRQAEKAIAREERALVKQAAREIRRGGEFDDD